MMRKSHFRFPVSCLYMPYLPHNVFFFFWFHFQGLPLIWTGIYVVMSILLYRYRFSCPEKNPLEHPSKVASTLQKIRDSSIWLTLFSSVCLPTIFQSQFQPVKLWSSNLNQAALLENWTGILDCATHLA